MKASPLVRAIVVRQLAEKVASAAESAMRAAMAVGEEAVPVVLRTALKGGEAAAAVPVAKEKIKHIEDPSYKPDPVSSTVHKLTKIVQKFADANASTGGAPSGSADNDSGTYRPYTPDKPFHERSPNSQIKSLFDCEGPAFRNQMADSSTVTKEAGDGNLQDAGAPSQTENRGPTPSPDDVMQHLRNLLAGGELTSHDAVNAAFNGMRAFDKTETAPIEDGSLGVGN